MFTMKLKEISMITKDVHLLILLLFDVYLLVAVQSYKLFVVLIESKFSFKLMLHCHGIGTCIVNMLSLTKATNGECYSMLKLRLWNYKLVKMKLISELC